MRIVVNPGSRLEVAGSFQIQRVGRTGRAIVVGDRDTGRVVTLADLLSSFLEDPDETVTGPIRIVIEAAS